MFTSFSLFSKVSDFFSGSLSSGSISTPFFSLKYVTMVTTWVIAKQ